MQGEETAAEPSDEKVSFPVLSKGDYGDAVGALQVLLRYRGFTMKNSFNRKGEPDCEFGDETEAALEKYTGFFFTNDVAWKKLIGDVG